MIDFLLHKYCYVHFANSMKLNMLTILNDIIPVCFYNLFTHLLICSYISLISFLYFAHLFDKWKLYSAILWYISLVTSKSANFEIK